MSRDDVDGLSKAGVDDGVPKEGVEDGGPKAMLEDGVLKGKKNFNVDTELGKGVKQASSVGVTRATARQDASLLYICTQSILNLKPYKLPRSHTRIRQSLNHDSLLSSHPLKLIAAIMGIIRSSFSFMMGTVFGVYVAQNYNVPNIKKLTNTGLLIAKHLEENYRKPKKKDDD
ncbi:hypothetical protein L1049_007271 [Liquidambar formosana]|uniref:Uncharacterized protein n=1 Tax=Liquidambar formosana TaxID=63359 RepID=A0AAP0RH55_LIQFO